MGVYRLNRTGGQVGRINSVIKAASEDYWWLAGGIDPANCVAAYQPIGAASYAASKVNLANPGTYDATEGVAPDWDAVNGWQFDGVDDYLDAGFAPYDIGTQYGSFAFRFTNYVSQNNYPVYAMNNYGIGYGVRYRVGIALYAANNCATANTGISSGESHTIIVADREIWVNGVYIGDMNSTGTSSVYLIYPHLVFGAQNNNGIITEFAKYHFVGFSAYNTKLNTTQVGAVTTAMNAL